MGNRILTITVHALIESVIGYGLTLTGSSTTVEDLQQIDTTILIPIARRVTGVGYSIRREVLYSLADMKTTQNRYLQKVANVADRILRAGRTQAQENLRRYFEKQGRHGQPWTPLESVMHREKITQQQQKRRKVKCDPIGGNKRIHA